MLMRALRNWSLPFGSLAIGLVSSALLVAQNSASPARPGLPRGKVEKVSVHGKSLEGNLEGDPADRDVFIYLPPSYSGANRRYPAVYLLHGYGFTGQGWMSFTNVAAAADKDAAGGMREMILVIPDSYTFYNGSMYSNSATTGYWEDFIAEDLVRYVDSHYRTIPDRMSRGLGGHSMGGYGTMRIGMKRPDVFGSLYAMSSCCLGDASPIAELTAAFETVKSPQDAKGAAQAQGGARGYTLGPLARAAAWSPNPKNPPFYFDLPTKGGILQPDILAKWAANDPLATIDQNISQLKKYRAIAADVGLQDPLLVSNRAMEDLLTRSSVPHSFETYEGDHLNKVAERVETKVLPFFSKNLTFK